MTSHTPAALGASLLIGCLVVELDMAAHGAQTLCEWSGGKGPAGTGAYFESLGDARGAASRDSALDHRSPLPSGRDNGMPVEPTSR